MSEYKSIYEGWDPDNIEFIDFNEGIKDYPKISISDILDEFNNSLDQWTLVKVRVKSEMIDDLTEIIKYEYRYRLYLSTVLERFGIINPEHTNDWQYWEKDLDGNTTHHP